MGNQFLCTECEATSDSLEKIANHVNTDHVKSQAFSEVFTKSRFKCEQCVVAFSAKAPWLKHMQETHGTHFPFKCNYCDFKCNRKDQAASHVQKAHKLTATPGVRQGFKCRLCGVIFLTKDPLIIHIRTIHSDVMRNQGLSQPAPGNEPLGNLNSIFPDFTNLAPVSASSNALKVETDFGIRPSDDGAQECGLGSESQDPLSIDDDTNTLSIDNDINTAVNDLLSINKEAIAAVEDLLGIDKEAVSAVEGILSMETKPLPELLDAAGPDKKITIQEETALEEKPLAEALPGNVAEVLPGNVRLLPEEKLHGNRIVVNSNSFRPKKAQTVGTAVKTQSTQAPGKTFAQPPTFPQQAEKQKLTAGLDDQVDDRQTSKKSSPQTSMSEPSTGVQQVIIFLSPAMRRNTLSNPTHYCS